MTTKRRERLSYYEKNRDKQAWYRDYVDSITMRRLSEEDRRRYKVNFDLFRNKIDIAEFNYVCKPFGSDVGELPASFQNRDIVSGKIKALIGMEMQRPFTYKVFATNPEATTAKEKATFEAIKQSVIETVMAPIRAQIEQESNMQMMQLMQQQQTMQGQMQGDPMQAGMGGAPQQPQMDMQAQMQQIQQQGAEKEKQMTPQEVKRYMEYEYQEPSEVLASQLLEYLRHKCDLKNVFSDMFKNALLTARSVVYVGIVNKEPAIWNIDPSRFNFSKSYDTKNIEDGEWAVCEYKMTPSQIASYFSEELSDKDLDLIYEFHERYKNHAEDLFSVHTMTSSQDISVLHCVWKSLRKIGFLTYVDESGEEQEMVVDEHYKLEKDLGEISIKWEWIPECYEGWKIEVTDPIYVRMRPVPGQLKDLDNIRECKLPYYGTVIDEYEGEETSLMDRLRSYQYFFNIAMYRLELLMASDKGKKLMMNINNVPDSLGIDIAKWQYFVESSPYIWYNPNEEGVTTGDANTVAKVMDLSLVSDIKKYIDIAEYIRQQAGKSVGITDQVEGQIGQYEAVRNTNQAITQSSYILEGYFNAHERSKVNILTALLELAKICYAVEKPVKLSYILDDFSSKTLEVDASLLHNSTFGIFVSSSAKSVQAKEMIQQLAQAGLQNQMIDFVDIISIMNAESAPEAKSILEASQKKKKEEMEAMQQQQAEQVKQLEEAKRQAQREKFEMDKELLILREEERRKTELATMSIMGASYNAEHDADGDGINDFLELAELSLKGEVQMEELRQKREDMEFQHRLQAQESQEKRQVMRKKILKNKAMR